MKIFKALTTIYLLQIFIYWVSPDVFEKLTLNGDLIDFLMQILAFIVFYLVIRKDLSLKSRTGKGLETFLRSRSFFFVFMFFILMGMWFQKAQRVKVIDFGVTDKFNGIDSFQFSSKELFKNTCNQKIYRRVTSEQKYVFFGLIPTHKQWMVRELYLCTGYPNIIFDLKLKPIMGGEEKSLDAQHVQWVKTLKSTKLNELKGVSRRYNTKYFCESIVEEQSDVFENNQFTCDSSAVVYTVDQSDDVKYLVIFQFICLLVLLRSVFV